jgi:hypothetical protein
MRFVLILVCLDLLPLQGQGLPGKWMAGDFHQHTLFTDGSHPLAKVWANGVKFGLHFQTNSEHGGSSPRDGEGRLWTDVSVHPKNPILGDGASKEMWRWQSIRDYAYPEIVRLRKLYPDRIFLSGLEWNVPTHEHSSTAIVGPDAAAMAQFEYLFDGSDRDFSGGLSQGWSGKMTSNEHAKAVAAVRWMQANQLGKGYIVMAHADRNSSFKVSDYRDFNNAGPNVAFGFEGIPGHQKSKERGGYSKTATDGGTFGGAGSAVAKIGGAWDALLAEGRKWWNFVSSDFHGESSDFWPGEYAKTWLFVEDIDEDGKYSETDVVRALERGNSFAVHGDLIDGLRFEVATDNGRGGKGRATMGETLKMANAGGVEITIRWRSPEKNHHGDRPVVDHVDLIEGQVTGRVEPGSAGYGSIENARARKVATFAAKDFKVGADGWRTVNYRVKSVAVDVYYRLRGTNLAANAAFETDAEGNPLIDSLAAANLGLKGEDLAWRDLWFYSNPVFVRVGK